jgi:hypothetical protein
MLRFKYALFFQHKLIPIKSVAPIVMKNNKEYKKQITDTFYNETNGYCIIPNVLSVDEVNTATKMFKEWQASIPNHDKVHLINPHGIYKFHEAGHQRHAWYIRTNKKVQDIYKKLWNCKKLITSFDGSCFIPKECSKKDKCWTHTDQGPGNNDQSYQSFVALTENKERTLVVYEKSHLYHETYFNEKKEMSKKNGIL